MNTIAAVWLIGTGCIWLAYAIASEKEPTAHGRDALAALGCGLGLIWPLFLAYLIIASPWIAWTIWHERHRPVQNQ